MYPQQTDADNGRKRIIILILVVVATIIAFMGLIALTNRNKKNSAANTASTTTQTYDKNSGDTVRTIKGENQTYGTTSDMPVFLGVNTLITHGVTSQQANNMEQAFLTYSQNNKLNIKQVSITESSVTTGMLNPGTNSQQNYAKFTVVFDNKTTVNAELRYSGLYTTELFLYDQSGKQLFDSGVLSPS